MTYKLEDFEVLELIGSGSFASCYKVCNKHTNEVIVWKVVEYGSLTEEKKQLLVTEVSLLRDLRHPNIVRYFHRIVCNDTKQLYILMEYCSGGDLSTLIKTCIRSNTLVDEGFVWRVLHQLSGALQACQSWLSKSVVLHRDIKPANVFLDEKGNVKLGDFGLACKLNAGQKGCSETMVGTPFYMSPEVMKGEVYNSKSDVWSLGCLVYELCALAPPFKAQNIKELSAKVNKGRFARIPAPYSDSLQRVLSSLLIVNQEYRPSTMDLIHHPVVLAHLQQQIPNRQSDHCDQNKSLPAGHKARLPSPVNREPEEVSKETFRGEWLGRLQNLRDREAALRDREEQLNEREHLLNRREHRVALMERMVREKIILAEVYLKRSKEARGNAGSARQKQFCPPAFRDLDESFSADPGDTSILPTSALINPAQYPKPSVFSRMPSERRVHFPDENSEEPAPVPQSKPTMLKVAEAIRASKAQLTSGGNPVQRTQQRVLHLPGYTGPTITVDVPVGEGSEEPETSTSSVESPVCTGSSEQNPFSPSVKLTVLFDDREDFRKSKCIGNNIDALNLEDHCRTSSRLKEHVSKVPSVDSLDVDVNQLKRNAFAGSMRHRRRVKKITTSVDSLLNDTVLREQKESSRQFDEICFDETTVKAPTASVLKQTFLRNNCVGGSTRQATKYSFPSFNDPQVMMDNMKNDARLNLKGKGRHYSESSLNCRKSFHEDKGKENVPMRHTSNRSNKNSVASSMLAIPSAAAAAATALVSRSKKAQTMYLR